MNAHDRATGVEDTDIAIVGAGVAGSYVAYRLSDWRERSQAGGQSLLSRLRQRNRVLRIDLYECSNRIGGRLWSARLPPDSRSCCEFGAMRFQPHWRLVCDLIKHLQLDRDTARFWFDRPENLIYARGIRLRQRELAAPVSGDRSPHLPYRLQEGERGRTVAALTLAAAEFGMPGFSTLRHEYQAALAQREWRAAAAIRQDYERRKYTSTVKGSRLRELSWSHLVDMCLSREAIDLIQDIGGYETLASCGGALNHFDAILDAPEEDRYLRLDAGFDSLPRTLHKRFSENGGQTHLLHRLAGLKAIGPPDDDTGYELVFDRRTADRSAVARIRIRARIVILAVPKRALELLDQDCFLFRDPMLRRHWNSTLSVGAAKLFLVYPWPWWKRLGVVEGRSTTDLPLRQVFYGSGERAIAERSRQHRAAAILAMYANGKTVEYWKALQDRGRPSPLPDGIAATDPNCADTEALLPPMASHEVVERAHALLMELHGVTEAPSPFNGYFQDWSKDPYGGAWHVWKEDQHSDPIVSSMRKPLPNHNVFIVGDCWAHEPGSVHGSLSNGEIVLQDHLGLPWPPWLAPEAAGLSLRKSK